MKDLVYKFVELSSVTDERLEEVVNEWVGKGWLLDGIRFAMTDASRRPAMAFVSFVREADGDEANASSPRATDETAG
jgi:hypothetical protein